MPELSSEVVVGGTGHIWVGPVDATPPSDATTAMDSAEWTELGFASEAGVTFTDSKTLVNIMAWQSFYPIRRIISDRDSTLAFVLRQWSGATVQFAFGGGLVEDNGGEFTYTAPSPEVVDERSLAVEWQDGNKHYRLYFPRGLVTDAVETNLVRTAAADLPITFGVISDGSVDAYTLFTDDTAFAHVSGS